MRDCDATLVLAHDLPRIGRDIEFECVIETVAAAGQPGALAINIKVDGLQPQLARHGVEQARVRDMSAPDGDRHQVADRPRLPRCTVIR